MNLENEPKDFLRGFSMGTKQLSIVWGGAPPVVGLCCPHQFNISSTSTHYKASFWTDVMFANFANELGHLRQFFRIT